MAKYRILSFTLLFILISGLTWPVAAQQPVDPLPVNQNGPEIVPGELLVKFKPAVGIQSSQQRAAQAGVTAVETIPAIEVVEVRVSPGQEASVIQQLRSRSDVEFVEPNYRVYAQEIPSDSNYLSQWGLPRIELTTAWDITRGSSDLVVAVVDTGIDLQHPDLNCLNSAGQSKLVSGWNFVDNNNNPDDNNGHGSHVAGIIGACTNNAAGVAGVAPDVRLMPLKALNDSGNGSYSDVADAIIYAADNGAKIVNLSLGGASFSSTLAAAVQYASSRGVLVVAASGNAGQPTIYYPAAYEQAVAVGSTTSSDTRSYFSNYGEGLDVVAPGSSIISTVPVPLGTSYQDYGYAYKSGTSMASPHVAGLAALIWSIAPQLTPEEVRAGIRATADDLGDQGVDPFYGYGRINALKALSPYAGINVQDTSNGSTIESLNFLIDDHTALPLAQSIKVSKLSAAAIGWTVSASPAETWLTITPGSAGQISTLAYAEYTLGVTRPGSYGTYTTNLTVTGSADGNGLTSSQTIAVRLTYVPKIERYYLPLMLRN
mgnify:CR=1 FL=1